LRALEFDIELDLSRHLRCLAGGTAQTDDLGLQDDARLQGGAACRELADAI
jgi:hypothetical protein